MLRSASERSDTGRAALMALGSPSLVVVLSPLIDTTMVDIVATLGARGLTTVVVDTCPPHLTQAEALTQRTPGEPAGPVETALMWRVRLLARRGDISALRAHGIPVVPWLGPGSLDAVLRDVARRARAPRMARR